MLEDYRIYLTNIRNNLIQCGVEFPISPLDTYGKLFTLGADLDDVLWYYHILAVGGSRDALKGCMFPLSGYYIEKMRQEFYEEYREFIKDYKKISLMQHLINKANSPTNAETSISDDEEIDLFDSEKEEDTTQVVNDLAPVKEEVKDAIETSNPLAKFLANLGNSFSPLDIEEPVEYQHHGIYLDEIDLSITEEDTISESHGVYLDEVDLSVIEKGTVSKSQGVFLDEVELSSRQESNTLLDGFQSHGVFLDEIEVEDSINPPEGIQYDENGFEIEYEDEETSEEGIEYEEEESSDDNIQYDENEFEIEYEDEDSSDDVQYDENGFEIEYEDEEESSDNGIEYDEYGFEIEYSSEDSDDGIQYDENGFEIEYEDEESSDDNIQYDENGFEIVPEEGTEEELPFENPPAGVNNSEYTKDLSDFLQDTTNAVLTKGKQLLYRGVRKLKD